MMNRLRNLREDNNLTQEQCAKIAFISRKSYERYENGLRVLPSDILIIFCKYYNVSADYVLGLIPNFRKLH